MRIGRGRALPERSDTLGLSLRLPHGQNGSFYFFISKKPAPYGQRMLENRPVNTFRELATWDSIELAVGVRNREDTIIKAIFCRVKLRK